MPNPDLTELRRLAEAVTEKNWKAVDFGCVYFGDGGFRIHHDCQPRERAAFIAAANPSAILSLLDRLEAAEASLKQIEHDYSIYPKQPYGTDGT
jgi:hypothetical protein